MGRSLRSWWHEKKLAAGLKLGLAQRGRTAPVEEPQGGNTIEVKMPARMTIEAKVYRAATGTWEDLGVISEGRIDLDGAEYERLIEAARRSSQSE